MSRAANRYPHAMPMSTEPPSARPARASPRPRHRLELSMLDRSRGGDDPVIAAYVTCPYGSTGSCAAIGALTLQSP